MLNPNTQDSPSIMIRYKEFSDKPIVIPKLEAILEVASKEMALVSIHIMYSRLQ
jgi:phosphatidylinositol-4,5-bisphosphate 3-kinase